MGRRAEGGSEEGAFDRSRTVRRLVVGGFDRHAVIFVFASWLRAAARRHG